MKVFHWLQMHSWHFDIVGNMHAVHNPVLCRTMLCDGDRCIYVSADILLLILGSDHLLGVPLSSNLVLVSGNIVFSVMLTPAKEAPLQQS